jgi:tetratricopeptide (TPR) repeat protein
MPYLLISVVGLIVYCNSFTAPFTLDDFGSITNNYAIRNPLDFKAIWEFYSNRFVLYYTISLNYFLFQNMPFGYHVVNFIIHIINGILVYSILYHLLGLDYFKDKLPGRYRKLVCTLSAIMFICHPVQVNAVTYIIQRTAALAATFYFAAVLNYLKYRIYHRKRYFAFTLLFTVIAMFTKENTITIPFMLILIELMFFLKDGRTKWVKRIAVFLVLLLTIPIIPATNLYLGGYSQSDPNVDFKASTSMDRMHYFYTQLNVILHYVQQLFIPYRLNFDYSNDYPISKTLWENYSYISLIIHAIIGIIALVNIRKNKLIALGILWFYIGLSVESSFISIKDVYFEHRLYFPIVGFIMFLTGLMLHETGKEKRPYLFKRPIEFFVVAMGFLIVMYSGVTLHRNYIFSDGIRLWTDVTRKAPNSDRAHCVLATNYLDSYELSDNKPAEYLEAAEREFKKAIELNSRNDTAHCNLAKVYNLKGEYEKAIEEAKSCNRIRKSKYAYYNLGTAYKNLGRTEDAIDAYLEGYKIDNKATFILEALGDIYSDIGDYDNARFYYEEIIKNNTYSKNTRIKEKLEKIKDLSGESKP